MALPLTTPGPLAFIPPPVAIGAANAIVPFVLPSAVGAAAAVTAAAAGAPVVAAVVGGLALGALISYGLSQWGQVNGPDRDALGEEVADPLKASGSYVKGGTSADGRDFAVGVYSFGIFYNGGWVSGFSSQNNVLPTPDGTNYIPSGLRWNELYPIPDPPGSAVPEAGPGFRGYIGDAESASGSPSNFGNTTFSGYFPSNISRLRWELVTNTTGGEVIEFNQPEPLPWLNPTQLPEPEELEENALPAIIPPLPLILPLAPVPGSTPVEPEPAALPDTPGSPSRPGAPAPVITPTQPRPFAPPWIQPNTPTAPGSVPGQFPSNPTQPTQPTAPDGTVTPTQPGPVTQTQPGSVVPWPGAPSIPAIGPAPRADLVGIAQEVGRIERKIDLMNTPGSGPNGFENLSELLGLLSLIYEFLTASASGTTYTLDSPCEVDEEGVKLPPIEIEAPGAATTFQALLNRTDALAELIQAHKNLKQPGCKHKLAGEIVTVNFQQIE
jgi:hypothetical protein